MAPIRDVLAAGREADWINPHKKPFAEVLAEGGITADMVKDASDRLARFAPLIALLFPETAEKGGIIESPLREVPKLQARFAEKYGAAVPGRLLLKMDSHLKVSGSVKARGGIYEVLKHAEDLALQGGILSGYEDDYRKLASPKARTFFSRHKIQVGSTGNLGMSIGIMGAALGFDAVVHMSADAKQWKKDLLRQRGATVKEYAGDYGEAVKQGRALSESDPMSYFVDDENSRTLFLGYAVAGERLTGQLTALGVTVDEAHPLFVHVPCGVGGAPGGIGFGLKLQYGDNVHVFFEEPVQSPCMLLGLATGLKEKICVQDAGLSGKTAADGLAVGRPSALVSGLADGFLSGEFTVDDSRLDPYLRDLYGSEGIFIEPSACAAFRGALALCSSAAGEAYCQKEGLTDKLASSAHVLWATGGSMVPEAVRAEYLNS